MMISQSVIETAKIALPTLIGGGTTRAARASVEKVSTPVNETERMMVPVLVRGFARRADSRRWPESYNFLTFLPSQNNIFPYFF